MKFSVVKFFAYNIRSTVLSGVKMYLVSDLLNQYNAVHKTNKQFYYYLVNKQTQELLTSKQKHTGTRNSGFQESSENDDNHWDIEGVIKYVTFSNVFCGAHSGYIVCEELLIACLMWVDPSFACSIRNS